MTPAAQAPRPLAVGDRIHGYCGGYFGRDHYDCGVVEAVGADWMVARTVGHDRRAFAATGPAILTALAEFRDNERCSWNADWCNERGCFADDDGQAAPVSPPAKRCGAPRKTAKYGTMLCQALRARMPDGTHAARCARHLGAADRARLAAAKPPQKR